MHKNCVKCNRQFPWGISAQDSVCFVCRWPARWSDKDERFYRNRLEDCKSLKQAAKDAGVSL